MIDPKEIARVSALKLTTDIQGWHHEEPIFERLVNALPNPAVYIEVGCYKGASLIRTGHFLESRGLDWQCYAVDFWQEPGLYEQFLHNVIFCGLEKRVTPIRDHSQSGAQALQRLGVQADLIYIDAGHDCVSCYNDMRAYWPLLKTGGVMFGDDFTEEKGVRDAVILFGMPFTNTYYHWELEPKL